ncbi:MAG: hypothetical protein LQ343_000105 [Gyalolechia ehrenbergii]|nr:MAG: hypothetical protein LQ343_000105 [Gyalolechia ehrenbergii]
MFSHIFTFFLLLALNVIAAPAPAPQAVADSGTAAPSSIPRKYTLQEAQAIIHEEFVQESSDYAAYAAIATPTTYSLSPEESAAEASIDAYFSTASFSDVPIVTSIPQSVLDELTATTGIYALPQPTDPCGPAVQTGEEWDTCTIHEDGTLNVDGSPFVWYSDEPSYYGVQCLPKPNNTSDGVDNAVPNLNTEMCNFDELCNAIQTDFATGLWHWNNNGGEGCALGIWLPDGDGVAQIPDSVRCRDAIYGMAGLYCTAGGPQGGDGLADSQVASVNLKLLPGGGQNGAQVNAGYPSYIIAPEILT